jgi:voltage-gated potassium channel
VRYIVLGFRVALSVVYGIDIAIRSALAPRHCAVIVYLLERHAPGSNIHTLGNALWWSIVTVTTVGYGDFYPVTAGGRITACVIMGIGLLTLAVVTAQVAAAFVAQGPSRARAAPPDDAARREVTLAELDQRLARIEQLLTGYSSRELALRSAGGRAVAAPTSCVFGDGVP